jgi:hypothetical protein
LPPPTNYLGSLAVPSGGASRRGLRHGGWRANILPSIAASWINDVPDGARTTLENFWRRILRAPFLRKPRSKSPAEAGLKWLSMEKLRVNGISSPLCAAGWPCPGSPLSSRSNMSRKARMDWADYLRDQAAKYRQLAETAEELGSDLRGGQPISGKAEDFVAVKVQTEPTSKRQRKAFGLSIPKLH